MRKVACGILAAVALGVLACEDGTAPDVVADVRVHIGNASPSAGPYTLRANGEVVASDFGLGAGELVLLRRGANTLRFEPASGEGFGLEPYYSGDYQDYGILLHGTDGQPEVEMLARAAFPDDGAAIRLVYAVRAVPATGSIFVRLTGNGTVTANIRYLQAISVAVEPGTYSFTVLYGESADAPDATFELGEITVQEGYSFLAVAPGAAGSGPETLVAF